MKLWEGEDADGVVWNSGLAKSPTPSPVNEAIGGKFSR